MIGTDVCQDILSAVNSEEKVREVFSQINFIKFVVPIWENLEISWAVAHHTSGSAKKPMRV